MSVEELIEKIAKKVDGEKGTNDNILIFTLSTCMWCKKCKTFLNDRNMTYRYVDVDKIEPQDKSKILNHLKNTYQERISYPFLVCEKGFVIGYNPNKYEELLEK
ncbi:MAG: glutaredoxin family protein [Promethearchaeota archaeon]